MDRDLTDTAIRLPLAFSGAELDRSPVQRRDSGWVERMRMRPDAGALVVSSDGLWIDGGRLVLAAPMAESVFLGLSGERPLFATDGRAEQGRPVGLREAVSDLPAEEAALAAYAASLLDWHRRHRFCANCGAPTELGEGGVIRRCPACAVEHHPRVDPVVIMLVTDGERVLLGRHRAWPEGRYSALAGFVTVGESLEEAVVREVDEEAGIAVGPPTYVSSQPWPFPSSLMLGFEAPWSGGEPGGRDDELQDVRWFGFEEVAAPGRPLLPPRSAIARRLIEGWLERHGVRLGPV